MFSIWIIVADYIRIYHVPILIGVRGQVVIIPCTIYTLWLISNTCKHT